MEKGDSQRPVAVDVFSGAGGLSLGFEQAGFDVVLAIEKDSVHAATHKFNFPNAAIINADVRTVTKAQLLEGVNEGLRLHGRASQTDKASIDVVIGGPPCQGFSFIGQRDASEERNKLVYAFERTVRDLRPKYFVMENVPGMKVGAQRKILTRLIRRFKQAGYRIVGDAAMQLNAADFGVPQDRKRLFIVGARRGVSLPGKPKPRKKLRTVADAIADLPNCDDYRTLIGADEVNLSDKRFYAELTAASAYAKVLMGLRSDPTDFSYRREHNPQVLTSSMRTLHDDDSKARFRSTPPDKLEPRSRFHRLDSDGLANTLRAGTGKDHGAHTSARPIHPTRARVITVREAARLHSFPDWFRFHVTKWHGFRQVGNSVPPMLARAVARTIITALDVQPTRPNQEIGLGNPELLCMSERIARKYFVRLDPPQTKRGARRSQRARRAVRTRSAMNRRNIKERVIRK